MPWSNQAVTLIVLVEEATGFSGLFGYSPAPGPGNLVFSIALNSGTDPYGNAYIGGGAWSYVFNSAANEYFACGLTSGQAGVGLAGLSFQTAPTQAGPWTDVASLAYEGGGLLTLAAVTQLELFAPLLTATGTIALDGNAAPTQEAGRAGIFATAAAGNLQFVSGSDGNQYATGQLDPITPSAQTITATAPVTVTGLSVPVAAQTYRVRGKVTYLGNQSAGTPTFGLTGPAASLVNLLGDFTVATNTSGATSPVTFFHRALPLSQAGPALVLNEFVTLTFEGVLTFSAAGALTVNAETSAAADSYQIQAGSWMELYPLD